jgi:methyl-accepting chemotaxis protein
MNSELKEASQSTATALVALQQAFEKQIAGRQTESAAVTEAFLQKKADLSGASRVRTLNLLLSAVIIAALIIGGYVITRSVTSPLNLAVARLTEISRGEGDLTQELPIRSGDEVGQLARSFNRFMSRQREMVGNISQVASELVDATVQIQGSSREVGSGAQEQLAAIKESEAALKGIVERPGDRQQYAQPGRCQPAMHLGDHGARCDHRGDCRADGLSVHLGGNGFVLVSGNVGI